MNIPRDQLHTLDLADLQTGERLPAVHPGAVLLQDFIEPMGLTRYRVAKSMGIPQRRIDEICRGERGVTADTALRLGVVFGMEPQFWLNLQTQYDLEATALTMGDRLKREVSPLSNTTREAA